MGSFWQSALGGAVAGAGKAASDLGNKYLDEQLLLQRAQVLEDMRIRSAGTIREQDYAFRNDPTRVATERANKVADIEAEGGARNSLAIKAAREVAADPTIRQGAIDTATAQAQARDKVERQSTIDRGLDPLYLKAKKAIAVAERQPESSASLASAELARAQLKALDNLQLIRTDLAKAVAAGDKKAEESLREKLDIFESKPGKADKLRSAIEGAEKTIQAASKVLNDPVASDQAKKEAEESVRQARVRIDAYSKTLGLDTAKPKVPEAQMHQDAEAAIKAGAPRDAVNARLREQGYAPLPEAGKRASPTTAPSAQAPMRQEAPPGSPQAKHDAAQSAAKQGFAARAAAETAARSQAQSQFESDATSMRPDDLARKYQDMGARQYLTPEQVIRLKQAEAEMIR